MNNIAMSEVTGGLIVKLTVTGVRVATLRFRAMALIMRFGAWVGGVGGVELDVK